MLTTRVVGIHSLSRGIKTGIIFKNY